MGIAGLLPMLRDIQRPRHIKDYAGQCLGVDAYVWLHRGLYSCPEEVATGQKTLKCVLLTLHLYWIGKADCCAHRKRYVAYAMKKIRMMRHFNVKPYIVFDGGLLPSKSGTESDRAKFVFPLAQTTTMKANVSVM